jgi:hypothetical protein
MQRGRHDAESREPLPFQEDAMKKLLMLGLVLLPLSAWASALVLPDWKTWDMDKNLGTFADALGSTVLADRVAGPVEGQMAAKISAQLVQWGGLWVLAPGSLEGVSAIRFSARASKPCKIQIGLNDSAKSVQVAFVRVLSDEWAEFEVPLSLFQKPDWTNPGGDKSKAFDPARLHDISLSPITLGQVDVAVGPIRAVRGKAKASTGLEEPKAGSEVVQDFQLLDKSSCGPFADDKSSISIDFSTDKDQARRVAAFKASIAAKGWAGYWMRAGDDWTGQDWRKAKVMLVTLKAESDGDYTVGFNDAGQNAYVARFHAKAGDWQTVSVPFSAFVLNPFYQPPQAKGGEQDLSRIETFNLAPSGEGKISYKVA